MIEFLYGITLGIIAGLFGAIAYYNRVLSDKIVDGLVDLWVEECENGTQEKMCREWKDIQDAK